MSNPFDQFDAPDLPAMVTAEAQRQGVDPRLALAIAHAESGLDPNVKPSAKGAIGVMQLMPETAKELGVDPGDLAQNIRGGVSYLKEQMDAFGNPILAAAAYNAGPGAVRGARGVPALPETEAYVRKVSDYLGSNPFDQFDNKPSSLEDAVPVASSPATHPDAPAAPVVVTNPETGKPYNDLQQRTYASLIQAGKLDPNAAPGSAAFPRGLVDEHDTPDPGSWYVDLRGNLKQAPGVDYAAEVASGAAAPFQTLGHDVMEQYRGAQARLTAGPPKTAGDLLRALVPDMGVPKIAADAFSLFPASVSGAVTRPAAAFIADHGPTPYAPSRLSFQNGRAVISGPVPLHGQDAVDAVQDMLNNALSAVRPAAPRAPAPSPMSLDELRAAKDAKYADVDASGFKFPQSDVQTLADDMAAHIRDLGGPKAAKLLANSDAMQARLDALAKQPGGVPLSQLDKLRSALYDILVKPGGPDALIGNAARANIDALINGSGAPDIAQARDLKTREIKMQAVTDKLGSADLRAGSTYSGGNYTNAVRQNLRPLIDPTSAQRIRNLTPEEAAVLRSVVRGTPGQNATRYVSKLLQNKLVQVPVGVLTAGKGPVVMEGAGYLLNKASQAQTDQAVQRLLDLISMGGKPPPGPPPFPTLSLAGRPAIPLQSPAGLVGAAAVARSVPQRQSAGH